MEHCKNIKEAYKQFGVDLTDVLPFTDQFPIKMKLLLASMETNHDIGCRANFYKGDYWIEILWSFKTIGSRGGCDLLGRTSLMSNDVQVTIRSRDLKEIPASRTFQISNFYWNSEHFVVRTFDYKCRELALIWTYSTQTDNEPQLLADKVVVPVSSYHDQLKQVVQDIEQFIAWQTNN